MTGSVSGDFIVPKGVDNVPNTAGATRWHGDVTDHDGHDQWVNVEHYNSKYVNWIPRNDTAGRCIGKGNTLSYGVTFSGPGINVALITSYSTDSRDCIYTGNGTAHHHWESGYGGSYTSMKARVLYSY
jgi:hypothetical protein